VVGFFVLVWIALVAILVFAPEVYTQTLQKVDGKSLAIEASLLIALSALFAAIDPPLQSTNDRQEAGQSHQEGTHERCLQTDS